MSNQGYYQNQGYNGPQQVPQAYHGGGQQGYNQGPYQPQYQQQGQPQYGQPPMNYGQQPQTVVVREKKDRGCLGACLAALCCCFVCEEGCECCADCCECFADCC